MNDDDDLTDPLLSLAQKIAEGSAVNPESEKEAAPDDTSRATLESLLEIAAISAAHRDTEHRFGTALTGAPNEPRYWGHLIILETIGSGEFGDVYRAHDTRLQVDVALKLSSVAAARSGEASRVLDEARLLAKVRHDNVVRVYGADQKQGRVGLWMDLVQGQTLEELTKSQGFSEREAINVGIELCRALAAVHRVGVLHGDIKAHNVIRQDGGHYVLVDFGAGRPLEATPEAGRDVIGTPVYLAPEVLEGQPRSTASDIYSLGVLLFHLVTNDYPVYAASRLAFIEAHRTGTPKRLRDLRPNLSDGFVALVEKAVSTNPAERFGSAGALQGALVKLVSPPPTAPMAPIDVAPLPTRRVPLGWTAWALIGAGVGGAAWAATSTWRANGNAPPLVATVAATTPPIASAGDSGVRSYDIEAAFYRIRSGDEEQLTSTSRLRVEDELRLSIQTTVPAYVYVVNEDEKGNAFLLYPLPNGSLARPVPANQPVRLPAEDNWRVDSVGDKEHFLVFASIDPLTAFDEIFKKLPAPERGQRKPPAVKLPSETIDTFRGVGGLAPTQPRRDIGARFRDLFTTPLEGRETTQGMWVRQLTIANPPD